MTEFTVTGIRYQFPMELSQEVRKQMAEKLTKFMQLITKNVPAHLRPAVLVPGRRNLMEFLQDTFTIDELNTVRRAQGMKGDGAALLRKWLSRGYCTFNPATQQYTKSPQFLEKHQKAA